MHRALAIRHDLLAGVTVALVAIPQCMAFAAIAGLPPASGLYAAVVMGLLGSALSKSPKLIFGPAVTTSTMVFAVLVTVSPAQPEQWPAIAGLLAILVGVLTVIAALLNVGQFVRFVSHSVLVGLTAGAAILIFGSQLAPFLGLEPVREPTLAAILWTTVAQLDQLDPPAALMALGTLLFVLLGSKLGPRFPAPFIAVVLAGLAAWAANQFGMGIDLEEIGRIPRGLPAGLTPRYDGPWNTDLIFGAVAIAAVGIIQTLAIAKSLEARERNGINAKRELTALGIANVLTGGLHGFPGAGSFGRSALNDMAGARTRGAGLICAATIALIVTLAAPLARHITLPAIAGLLMATAWSMVDWGRFKDILLRGGHDRIVLLTTVLSVFIVPIHWAVLIGLAVSIAIFLRRVSQLRLEEMVSGEHGQFHEHPVDDQTGKSVITMLQIEGPLFFAHADELAQMLRGIARHAPGVIIVRMRRTQQIDFSVITALNAVVEDYRAAGGALIICGLTPEMRAALRHSPLGRTVPAKYLLKTTRKVFGSAHTAIKLAESLVPPDARDERRLFRSAAALASD